MCSDFPVWSLGALVGFSGSNGNMAIEQLAGEPDGLRDSLLRDCYADTTEALSATEQIAAKIDDLSVNENIAAYSAELDTLLAEARSELDEQSAEVQRMLAEESSKNQQLQTMYAEMRGEQHQLEDERWRLEAYQELEELKQQLLSRADALHGIEELDGLEHPNPFKVEDGVSQETVPPVPAAEETAESEELETVELEKMMDAAMREMGQRLSDAHVAGIEMEEQKLRLQQELASLRAEIMDVEQETATLVAPKADEPADGDDA